LKGGGGDDDVTFIFVTCVIPLLMDATYVRMFTFGEWSDWDFNRFQSSYEVFC